MAATRRTPRASSPLEEFEHPPFPGFDREAFRFLKDLAKNNDRAWLTPERKAIYQTHLLEPARQLLGELRTRFAAEGLPFVPDPKTGIMRLYRDTRFSKDKRPFKTNLGATVPFAGEGRDGLGNYLHIAPGECFYGGGAWSVEPVQLKRLRAAIDRDPERLRGILARLETSFAPVEGESLKRAPAGYDESHPAIDLLKMKQMFATRRFDDALAGSPGLVDWLVEQTRHTLEFNQFLVDTMRA
ncbi:MAG TPA: DUF2461 domain-containing protein [Candidatus Kapabacteria bacterium]|nr:DUF2461 domain-containing protein [Candidatus Kapabacteria bacterium]